MVTTLAATFEPYRRELRYHCYLLLGSLTDADDMVQETMKRAVTATERFEGRAEVRTWLFRIATHACIDELRRLKRRRLWSTTRPNGTDDDPDEIELERWIQPFPDALLPEQRHARIEAVTLAFVAALQWLPPRQRAVFVLRDTLGWSADQVADLLDMTPTAVHSALVRARASVAMRKGDRKSSPDHVGTARKLAAAFERVDVDALSTILRADVELHMPPWRLWFRGRAALLAFLQRKILPGRELVATVTRANDRHAIALHDRAGGAPLGVQVLELDRAHRVSRIYAFAMPGIVERFATRPG